MTELESLQQAFEEMKSLAAQRLEALKEAERQSASLTWLFTHCLAIGMDCKSDSGKWEHDIALLTSNQKKEIESLREQLAQAEINFALEHDDKVELEQQLATSQKREVMLREAIDRQPYTMDKQVCEALAATSDLDRYILCEKEPVAHVDEDDDNKWATLVVDIDIRLGTPLYRPRRPK